MFPNFFWRYYCIAFNAGSAADRIKGLTTVIVAFVMFSLLISFEKVWNAKLTQNFYADALFLFIFFITFKVALLREHTHEKK